MQQNHKSGYDGCPPTLDLFTSVPTPELSGPRHSECGTYGIVIFHNLSDAVLMKVLGEKQLNKWKLCQMAKLHPLTLKSSSLFAPE